MKDYVIVTDNTCDLDENILKKYNIDIIMLPYSINDTVYSQENSIPLKDFYDMIRGGSMPTTMACNPENYRDYFTKYLEQGKDVLYIAFAGSMSSSCSNAMIVANELSEEYPNNKVVVVDSNAASAGEGLIVYKAALQREAGKTIDEVATYVSEISPNVCHFITVDDLKHLHRGGRVSKTTAIVGTLVNVKPILHVNDEGKIVSYKNVRGRKKALNSLVDIMEELTKDYNVKNDTIMISHGDAPEDAEYVASEIKQRFGIEDVIITYASQTIGSHTGAGLVAIFFMGEHR